MACGEDHRMTDSPLATPPERKTAEQETKHQTARPPQAGKTLIVYYSYTNHTHAIVNDLRTQIEADVIRIEPAEKGLDYAANNYAIGSAQIAAIRENPQVAASYPAIDPVEVRMEDYGTVIVAAPLWLEPDGGSHADLLVRPRQRDGGQAHRACRVERKQRHQRRGVGCQTACP